MRTSLFITLIVTFSVGCLAAQTAPQPGLMLPDRVLSADADTGLRLPPPQAAGSDTTGGIMPAVKSILFGPRVGIETNEGKRVTFIEKANLFMPLSPFEAYSHTGIKGFLASAFLGPRVGMQLDERNIRMKEWLGLVPVLAVGAHLMMSDDPSAAMVIAEVGIAAVLSRLWPAWDAFRGRTMIEIERLEDLRK